MDLRLGRVRPDLGLEKVADLTAHVGVPRGLAIVVHGKEAVDVHHGQLSVRVRLEELLVPAIRAAEGAEEADGAGREVHDEVVERRRDTEGRRPARRLSFLWGALDHRFDRPLNAFIRLGRPQQVLDGSRDEGMSILVEGTHEIIDLDVFSSDSTSRDRDEGYLVASNGLPKVGIAIRIEVVGPGEDATLAGSHRKGAHPGHDVAHGLACSKAVRQLLMLGTQSAVPVDLGVVEVENKIFDLDFDVHVGFAGQHFISEGPKLRVGPNVFRLVDHRLDIGILVQQQVGDDGLVGMIFLS